MARLMLMLLFVGCASPEVKPTPVVEPTPEPTPTPEVEPTPEPAPAEEAVEEPVDCRLPCRELAVVPFSRAPAVFADDCSYPLADPGQCDFYERLARCVREEAKSAPDTWTWEMLGTHEEGLSSPETAGEPSRAKRARLAKNRAANLARLDRLAKECRAGPHPTAGAMELDIDARVVRFGERSFTFPAGVAVEKTRIIDLGTERILAELRDQAVDVGGWLMDRYRIYAVRKDALVSLGEALLDDDTYWVIPGDGALYQTVERHVVRGYLQELRFGAAKVTLKETAIEGYVCNDCTACPFVYVERDGAFVEAGEVLRYLAGAHAERSDDLWIDVNGPIVTLEVRELKDETSYLDALWLEVDGVRVAARACADACADDAHYVVLERGQTQRFVFDVPAGTTRARVVANGYYLPR